MLLRTDLVDKLKRVRDLREQQSELRRALASTRERESKRALLVRIELLESNIRDASNEIKFVNKTPLSAEQPPPVDRSRERGVGDLAELFFSSLGITKERYVAFKVDLMLDGDCDCEERKKWLNEMGKRLGVSKAADRFYDWLESKKKPRRDEKSSPRSDAGDAGQT